MRLQSSHMSAFAFAAVLTLSGCVNLGGGKPPAMLLTITADSRLAADTVRSASAAEAITIGVPSVPQAIAVTRVAVAESPVAVSYVKDAVWVEPPARLFQRLLAETVAAQTGKLVADPRQLNAAAGTQLTGSLQSFGIDAEKQQAVVVYDATISREMGKKIETRRFEARVRVSVIDAASIGSPLNQAANKVATDVAKWVGQ